MRISLKALVLAASFISLVTILRFQYDGHGDANTVDKIRVTHRHNQKTESIGSALRKCILTEMPDGDVHGFVERVVNKCVERYTTIRNDSFLQLKMGRFDEVKYFLPAFKKADISECKWLTIGIGGDTMVEKELLKKYRKCKVFGIEASRDQYSDFEKIGTVIPHAVGPQAGNISMRIRIKSNYYNKVIPVKPLAEVLDKYLGTRLVHFVTVDIEGGERDIVSALRKNEKLDREKVIFCQMDVEFHFTDVNANRNKFKDFNFSEFWEDFLRDSPYVPIIVLPFFGRHRKVTFVHTEEPKCAEFFALQRYFLINEKLTI